MTSGDPKADLQTLQRRVDESVSTVKRVFEAASDCMGVISVKEGRFLAANPAFEALTGYLASELQWMHVWELWRPDMADEARRGFRNIVETGSGADTEVPLLRKDGAILTVEFAARSMRYQGQDALLVIIVEISDRKEAERREAELDEVRVKLIEAVQQATRVRDALTGVATEVGALNGGAKAAERLAQVAEELTELEGRLSELTPTQST